MRLLPLTLLPLLCACGGKHSASDDAYAATVRESARLSERASNDGLVEQRIDLNGDDKPEVYNFYRERAEAPRLLVRKETDLNWDGRIDVWTWFDENGLIEKEELDGDFDSRRDWVDHYQGGKRVMSEVDTDYNGVFDLFKYYEGGKIRRKERDTNADGRMDYWEYFDDQGKVIKTGKDIDGDGVMDLRDE